MNIGITEPKYAILDDRFQVVVKLSRGPEGNLVLFNEYVCYRLAILIDIPMPYSGICVMDENTEVLDPDIASDNNYGYAFYSTFMPKTTTKEALEQASIEFKNRIHCEMIKKFIEECPQEWRPAKESENVLAEYLMYRINHFDVIVSTILNYIK